jgi:hypothetical protein
VNAVQGSYRPVDDTLRAIEAVRAAAHRHALRGVRWRLDRQVSNVGRLRSLLEEAAPSSSLGWSIQVHDAVDPVLRQSPATVATSDSGVLDAVESWCVIEAPVVRRLSSSPNLRDLRPQGPMEARTAYRS